MRSKPTKISARSLVWSVLILLTMGTVAAQNSSGGAADDKPEIVILDEIVAKVNHEIITLTDLQKELNNLRLSVQEEIQDPQQAEKEFEKRRRQLLKSMIENKLILQRAEELGVSANIDVDVAEYMENLRKEAGVPSLDVLDQYLKQRGSSLAEFRENVKRRMISDALLQQFVYSRITLLTPEIEAYYQENIERFTEPATVRLAEILFLKEGKDPAEVRRRAEEVLQRLKAGESFEDLARQYSEGPTAAQGGDIGEFKKGSMNEQLEEAVFQLEPGQVTDIIETDYGFQIVKVLSKTPARQKPLDEVRRQIENELYRKKALPELQDFLRELKEQSYIYVSPKYRDQFDLDDL